MVSSGACWLWTPRGWATGPSSSNRRPIARRLNSPIGRSSPPTTIRQALAELARLSAVVTYEFENVPVAAAKLLAESVPVFPPPRALEVSQDRLVEKRFLNGIGISTADFLPVDNDADLASALSDFGGSGVLKTCRMGYDGKGQRVFRDFGGDVDGTHAAMGGVPLILESLVSFEREISIIAARGSDGALAAYDPAENVHRDGILHTSTVPARIRRKPPRPRAPTPSRSLKRSTMSASSASSSSRSVTARCWSTRSRRASTIQATGPKPPAHSRNSNSISARSPACRSATRRAIPIA